MNAQADASSRATEVGEALSRLAIEAFGLLGLFIVLAIFTFPDPSDRSAGSMTPAGAAGASGEGGGSGPAVDLTPKQKADKERAEKIKAAVEMARKLKDVKKDAIEVREKADKRAADMDKTFEDMEKQSQ